MLQRASRRQHPVDCSVTEPNAREKAYTTKALYQEQRAARQGCSNAVVHVYVCVRAPEHTNLSRCAVVRSNFFLLERKKLLPTRTQPSSPESPLSPVVRHTKARNTRARRDCYKDARGADPDALDDSCRAASIAPPNACHHDKRHAVEAGCRRLAPAFSVNHVHRRQSCGAHARL